MNADTNVHLARSPFAQVILPLSLPVALALREGMRAGNVSEDTYIVSGFFGNIDAFNLTEFSGHPVTLIPEFSHEGMLAVHKMATKLLKAGAKEVKIFPYPIKTAYLSEHIFTATVCSPWKRELLKELIDLDHVEVVSAFVRRIAETALPMTKFETLLFELGLTSQSETCQRALPEELYIPALGEVSANAGAVDFEGKPSLETLVSEGYILFIWGGYDSGKTFVLLTLIIGIATGQSAFCFENNGHPQVVGVLDGELTPAQFTSRIEQLAANNSQKHLLKMNIRPLLARDPKVGPIDLLDKNFQEKLLNTLKRLNITVLVIDNLISLASKALKGREDDLFTFFYRLERMGVAVVFVNHAKKDNEDFKGSVDLGSKSQTIIHVEGRKVLEKDEKASEAVRTALANAGDAVVRLNFTKCKVPPSLNQKHEVYHLPVGGTWRFIEGNVTDLKPFEPLEEYEEANCPTTFLPASEHVMELSASAADAGTVHNDSASASSTEPVNRLTPDQQRLNDLFLSGIKPLSRSEVQKELNWGEDKAGNELKALKGMGLIKGGGSGRYYTYVKA